MNTKQKILNEALTLFSEKGYSAAYVGDIAEAVGIKTPSLYKHYKSKQAIFDELMLQFQETATAMMSQLETALTNSQEPFGDNFYSNVCNRFFEDYLMDDFCNKIIRLMSIEQFNNEEIQKQYDRWMFDEPLKFQSIVFAMLMEMGVIRKMDSDYLAVKYYAPIFFFAQRWLFCGKLTEEKKNSFRTYAYKHFEIFFSEMGEV